MIFSGARTAICRNAGGADFTGDEKEFSVFDSLSWTEAQKRDTRQYRPGMAIHFHRRTARFAKDETVAVVAVENDALKVERVDGSESIFPLGQGSALFDVGEKRKLKIAAGDKLLLQANASRKRFINGELVEVLAIQGDSVLLADGRVIPQNYRTFTHGYAVTSHAAQGKTVDEVLVVASSRSLPAINQQQFYVSISAGDLQIDGRKFTGLVLGVQEPRGLRPVIGMQTLLFAGQFVMDVIPSALFATVESESLFHGCVFHSDDFMADDFDSGRELV